MGAKKEFIGTVVSDKMQKTCIVRIVRGSKHAKYSRVIKYANKFKAHDEKGIAKMGDTVRIVETRPLSKDKHFYVAEVIRKATAAHIAVKEEAL